MQVQINQTAEKKSFRKAIQLEKKIVIAPQRINKIIPLTIIIIIIVRFFTSKEASAYARAISPIKKARTIQYGYLKC